jgi:site-specific recombinase XerD
VVCRLCGEKLRTDLELKKTLSWAVLTVKMNAEARKSGAAEKTEEAYRSLYPLFTSQKGGSLSREQVHRIFKGIAERAGMPKERRFVHILKHSRASHLVGSMDVALLRQLLGHRNTSDFSVLRIPFR